MATIATYKFDNSNDFENAKDKINNEVGSSSYYGWDYDNYNYQIYIKDDCEKVSLVSKICKGHDGKSC